MAEPSRATLRIVHGLGEHGGRYDELARFLAGHGISSYAIDLRGHGASGGKRGHAPSFQRLIDDVAAFSRLTPGNGLPCFLLGHSFGGLLALRTLEQGRAGALAGAILSAPLLGLAFGDRPWHRAAGVVLSRIAPTLRLPNGIDPAHISHDPSEVAAYVGDPLVHDRITPRLYQEMRSAMRAAAEEAPDVTIPVLLLAPGDDRITNVPVALQVVRHFSGDVQVRSYPAFHHEPFHERGREKVFGDVLAWLEERLS
jgi:alpha-beta hydrolase superfamily lysophospholipase